MRYAVDQAPGHEGCDTENLHAVYAARMDVRASLGIFRGRFSVVLASTQMLLKLNQDSSCPGSLVLARMTPKLQCQASRLTGAKYHGACEALLKHARTP